MFRNALPGRKQRQLSMLLAAFVKRIDSACGKMRADYVPVNTKTPLRDTLLRYLGGRK